MEKFRLFETAELEILQWSLEDHAAKIIVLAEEHGFNSSRPNLAYLDTQILRNEIAAELDERAQPAVSTHPDHCLCDAHFTGLRPKEMQAEMDRRVLRSHEFAMARKAADGS